MSRRRALLAVVALGGCSDAPLAPDLRDLEPGVRAAVQAAQTRFEQRDAAAGSASARAAARGELCRAYHAHHLLASAADCYRRAIRTADEDYRWHYYLAHVHLDRGELDAAQRRFRATLARRPGYVPAQYRLAQVAIARGEPDRALQWLDEIPAAERGAAVLAATGQAALLNDDYRAALDAFGRALALQPDADRLHYLVAMAWRGLGDRGRAAAELERAGETDPRFDDPLLRELARLSSSAELLLERGRAALDRGDLATAEREFRAAVAGAPDDPSAHATLALLLQRAGRHAAALDHLQRAAALAPANPTYRYLAGTVHERSGDETAAVAAYRRAVELDPDYAEPRVLLGHAAMRRGAWGAALEHYAAAAQAAQQSVVARYHAGLAAAAAGRCSDAARYLEAALQRQGSYAPAIMSLVRVRAVCASPNVDHAANVALARALHAAAPANPDVQATLALALAASGEFAAAVAAQPEAEDYREWLGLYRAARVPTAPWPAGAAVYRPPLLGRQ